MVTSNLVLRNLIIMICRHTHWDKHRSIDMFSSVSEDRELSLYRRLAMIISLEVNADL